MDGSPQNLIPSTKSPLFVDKNQKNPMSSTKTAGFVDGVNLFSEKAYPNAAGFVDGVNLFSEKAYPNATSRIIMREKPRANMRVPALECWPDDISGMSSSTTT